MINNLHHYYLQQMGIEPWLTRQTAPQSNVKLMILAEDFPFEGKAANLLNKMLNSIGLSPEDISALPPNSDQSVPILVLGAKPAQQLLHNTESLLSLRQKIYDFKGQQVLVSYHPNDLLDHPKDKKNAYQDLLRVEQLLTHSL